MAKLNTGNEILVDVGELQRQDWITSGSNGCFAEELQTCRMDQKKQAYTDYIYLAIVAVFCCFPFGLCATFAANSANNDRKSGNYEDAREKNHTAIRLIIASYIFGVIGAFIMLAMHLT